MKTLNAIIVTAAIGIYAIFLVSNANSNLEMNVFPADETQRAIVKISVPKNSEASIFVSNSDGKLIHEENIKAGTEYDKIYDFSMLKDGVYNLNSNADFTSITKQVKVYGSSIDIISKEVEFKPVFAMNNSSF